MSEELNLRQTAERLVYWCNRIERASTEAEENECCNERDRILALFRKVDAERASPTPEGGGEDAIAAAKRIVASVAEADAMLVARALLSSPRVEEVRRMREALEYYARGCDATDSIESAARGDIDLAMAVENFNEDCGDRARAALSPPVG